MKVKFIHKKKYCSKCNKLMREWFDYQVFTGHSCDNCGNFEKVEINK